MQFQLKNVNLFIVHSQKKNIQKISDNYCLKKHLQHSFKKQERKKRNPAVTTDFDCRFDEKCYIKLKK